MIAYLCTYFLHFFFLGVFVWDLSHINYKRDNWEFQAPFVLWKTFGITTCCFPYALTDSFIRIPCNRGNNLTAVWSKSHDTVRHGSVSNLHTNSTIQVSLQNCNPHTLHSLFCFFSLETLTSLFSLLRLQFNSEEQVSFTNSYDPFFLLAYNNCLFVHCYILKNNISLLLFTMVVVPFCSSVSLRIKNLVFCFSCKNCDAKTRLII